MGTSTMPFRSWTHLFVQAVPTDLSRIRSILLPTVLTVVHLMPTASSSPTTQRTVSALVAILNPIPPIAILEIMRLTRWCPVDDDCLKSTCSELKTLLSRRCSQKHAAISFALHTTFQG